jgi:hypothetical protein
MEMGRTKVIACATVIEDLLPLLPAEVRTQTLDFGLHLRPAELKRSLQKAITASEDWAETLILGYGLCSQAVIGLRSAACTLVVPRVDDCIAIFLGSCSAYRREVRREPGTYYLTKGWIEAGDTPFEEHSRLVEKYGPARAGRMTRLLFRNYTRLVFINTRQDGLDRYRAYTREQGARFGLRYEEIDGEPTLLHKMLYGPWDEEILVVPPGRTIAYEDFAHRPNERN